MKLIEFKVRPYRASGILAPIETHCSTGGVEVSSIPWNTKIERVKFYPPTSTPNYYDIVYGKLVESREIEVEEKWLPKVGDFFNYLDSKGEPTTWKGVLCTKIDEAGNIRGRGLDKSSSSFEMTGSFSPSWNLVKVEDPNLPWTPRVGEWFNARYKSTRETDHAQDYDNILCSKVNGNGTWGDSGRLLFVPGHWTFEKSTPPVPKGGDKIRSNYGIELIVIDRNSWPNLDKAYSDHRGGKLRIEDEGYGLNPECGGLEYFNLTNFTKL